MDGQLGSSEITNLIFDSLSRTGVTIVTDSEACIILFWKYYANKLDTLNKGALNTVVPIVNTCADVGYGMAVAGLTHVNACKHIFWGHVIATTIALFFAIPLGILIYG